MGRAAAFRFGPSAGAIFILALSGTSAVPQESPSVGFERDIRPFFETYCVRCHNPEKKKGKFVLELSDGNVDRFRSGYASTLERLRAADMPPEEEPQPDPAVVRRVAEWIAQGLSGAGRSASPESPSAPSEGNHLPHALLFGTPQTETVPPPPRLWRLGPGAYLEGFVGGLRAKNAKELSQPFGLIPDPGIRDYAALYVIDGAATEVLLRNAERIVAAQEAVREFAPLRQPDAAPTRPELETAIRAQVRMALAREPEAREVEALLSLYDRNLKVADPASAARAMLMAPLLLPEASYRFELGRGAEVRPGVRLLSPREIAFAVSLAISDRREPGVFEAAGRGGLATRQDVATHVRRMLDDPKFPKPRLLGFFREYFGYDRAIDVFKEKPEDVVFAPQQMIRDTDQLILFILERDREVLRELLTTPKSFVNWAPPREDKKTKQLVLKRAVEAHPINDRGRKHPEAAYGLQDWPAEQPVDLPGDRLGILMQPSWLVAWSGNFDNDPVRRGRWIRERLLGGRVPDLPLGVAAKVPDDPHRTLRDRLGVTRDAACWKCHRKMDLLGLPFEAFDPYGKPREQEMVVDVEATARNVDKKGKVQGRIFRSAPLLTSGEVSSSGDPAIDGALGSPAELVRRLAGSARVRQVFIRHVFRYYLGRNETAGDAATLQEADRAYVESAGSYKALLVSLLSSESFLYRSTGGSK